MTHERARERAASIPPTKFHTPTCFVCKGECIQDIHSCLLVGTHDSNEITSLAFGEVGCAWSTAIAHPYKSFCGENCKQKFRQSLGEPTENDKVSTIQSKWKPKYIGVTER